MPDHRGPQAPLDAAPPLARELEARVAVADKTCGLGGQTRFKLKRGRMRARVLLFRRAMLAVGWLLYLPSIRQGLFAGRFVVRWRSPTTAGACASWHLDWMARLARRRLLVFSGIRLETIPTGERIFPVGMALKMGR